MKQSTRLLLDVSGRLIYLVGTSLVIYFAGGGQAFIHKPVGVVYLILWNTWWVVTFLGRQKGKQTKYDPGKNWLVIISGFISVPFLIFVPAWEYTHFSGPLCRDGWLSWFGLAAFALGIMIQSIAMWQLRSFYTVRLGVQEHQDLVTTGLYSRIRHPGYFSYLLSITGISLALGSLATLIFTIPIFLFLKSRIASEEAMLIAEFGDSYQRYMKKTRRLIPFMY
jgi:protein-S-isoprenylcysteine O-methyltransferase Ste14